MTDTYNGPAAIGFLCSGSLNPQKNQPWQSMVFSHVTEEEAEVYTKQSPQQVTVT
jgi:hypothetical protein